LSSSIPRCRISTYAHPLGIDGEGERTTTSSLNWKSQIEQSPVARTSSRALEEVSSLPCGERHLVIVASMVAMYLTSDSARGPGLETATRSLVARSGALTRAPVPMLTGWRRAYREFDA
jgi:hypothetical protein